MVERAVLFLSFVLVWQTCFNSESPDFLIRDRLLRKRVEQYVGEPASSLPGVLWASHSVGTQILQ